MGETGFLIYQNKICDIWYQCCHLQGDEAPLGMLEPEWAWLWLRLAPTSISEVAIGWRNKICKAHVLVRSPWGQKFIAGCQNWRFAKPVSVAWRRTRSLPDADVVDVKGVITLPHFWPNRSWCLRCWHIILGFKNALSGQVSLNLVWVGAAALVPRKVQKQKIAEWQSVVLGLLGHGLRRPSIISWARRIFVLDFS